MIIERVEVENFRSIVAPLEVTFDARLNVVFGPNEAGKTTLAEAIWAGLMLPAKGTTKPHEAMKNRERNDTPRVKITLRDGDCRYEITKEFSGQTGETRLVEFEGRKERHRTERDEAERRLREVLGVGNAKRGKLKDDDRGLWGLTWVRHGEAGLGPGAQLNPMARGRLNEQLGAMTDAVLAGEMGNRLFAAAEQEYKTYFTGGGKVSGAASSPLNQASTAFKEAKSELDELLQRQRNHARLVEEYEGVDEELCRARADLPKLEERVRTARQAYEERQSEEVELEKLQKSVTRAREEVELWKSRHDERTAWNDEVQEKRARHQEATKKLTGVKADLAGVDERLSTAQKILDQRRGERDEATSALRRARGLENLARARHDHEQLAETLESAQQHAEALREARSRVNATAITEARLRNLEALDEGRRDAEADLNAAVARVSVTRHSDVEIRRDGEPLAGHDGAEEEFPVSVPTTLEIGEVATITVKPGGTDLEELRENVKTQKEELRGALDEVGVKDLSDARRQLGARKHTEERIENLERELQRVAPEGLEALQTQLVSAESRRDHEVAALKELEATDQELQNASEERNDAIRKEVTAAEKAQEVANRTFEEARNAVNNAQLERAGLEKRKAALSQEISMLDERLEELTEKLKAHVKKHGDDARLSGEIARHEQALEQTQSDLATLREQLVQRPLEDYETALAAAERNLKSLTDDLEAKQNQQAKLHGALTQSDVEGLHARIAEAEDRFEGAARDLRRQEERAAAAECLFTTMKEKRAEIEAHYRAPLERRLSGLVSKMFPGAQVTLDETLDLASIHRADETTGERRDTFQQLSAGASEQLGILARLAMAQTVAPEGGMPVLLDDTFVWTDENRFQRLADVLHSVSETTQIILLTCHWERLRRLGLAPHQTIDLASLRHATT